MWNYNEYKGFLYEGDTRTLAESPYSRSQLLSKYNKPLTAALFVERQDVWKETQEERGIEPLYSLGEVERDGKPSAYQIYMNSVDEFEAAMKLVGSLYHWQALCGKDWFKQELTQWRSHMALRDYSLAKRAVLKDVRKGDGPAARKLLEMSNKVINPPVPKKTKESQPEKPEEDQDLAALAAKYLYS